MQMGTDVLKWQTPSSDSTDGKAPNRRVHHLPSVYIIGAILDNLEQIRAVQ